MTEAEEKQLRRFANRFLEVVGELERERDEWRDRFECLAYEVEDLITQVPGVPGHSGVVPWSSVLETGAMPTMRQYLAERDRQHGLQEGEVA